MSATAPKNEFQFLSEIPIDIEHTLYQLLRTFQSVRDGLAELPKNSKDHYARLGITNKNERQIIILVNSKALSVGVLDFAGARPEDFNKWQKWSDPTASRAQPNSDIEGGHGNGGKAFMVWGSLTDSFMESVVDSSRTKMGYKNDQQSRRYYPAYIKENGTLLNHVPETNARKSLEAVLNRFRARFGGLPLEAQQIFQKRAAFTIVEVNSVRDWKSRRQSTVKNMILDLSNVLRQHPQMALTLESCTVTVIVDGKPTAESPLTVVYPEPMPGFEEIPQIPLPAQIVDPETGEEIETMSTKDDYLRLRTSRRHLRQTDKTLNVLRIRNGRNVVANLSIADLAPQNESAFIFGDLKLGAIEGSHLSGSDRKGLADTPLTRAVRQWASEQIEILATRLQKALAKDHKQQDRERANDSLSRMRDLMRRFLEPDQEPGSGDEEGGRKGHGESGDNPTPDPVMRGQRIDKVLLEPTRDQLAMAVGTSLPLIIRCYEVSESGNELPVIVRPENFSLARADGAPECVLNANGLLHVTSAGKGMIRVKEVTSGITSNEIQLESVLCSGADIITVDRLLLKGERIALTISFHTDQGPRQGLLIEGHVDETDRGRVSRNAIFTAGRQEGPVTVRVRWGSKPTDSSSVQLRIGPESLPPRRRGGSEGAGNIPYILLCGTPAPGMDDLPPDQRTHHGGEHHPTIIEEPPFDSVVWINPNSKEALRVRHGRGGTKGSAGIATKTFTQFVALKAFDILKRLKVRQEIGEASVTELQFRNQLAVAEMDCATFVDSAWDIASNISSPESEAVA